MRVRRMCMRHRRTLGVFALVPLGILAAGPLDAQVVRGVVLEVGSGTPVFGARLLLRSQDDEVRAGVISDESGAFELHAEFGGLVRLEVSHFAYADWATSSFALPTDAELDVEVRLDIEAIPLEPIVVVARSSSSARRLRAFDDRRDGLGGFGGFFISVEDVEARASATTTGLVRGTPGMDVRLIDSGGLHRNVIRSRGCLSRTFIDGVEIQQDRGHSVDDLLAPDRVEGIEVYPRALSAPAQFNSALGPDCGVVLFWSREPSPSPSTYWRPGRLAAGFGVFLGLLTLGLVGG